MCEALLVFRTRSVDPNDDCVFSGTPYSHLEDLNAMFSDGLVGPFNLSYYEPIVNFIAIMWIIVAIVFSTFPTVKTVTSNSTN
jgi:hypothetical protein